MEIERIVPLWLVWLAVGGAGALAIAAVARVFVALVDLDAS